MRSALNRAEPVAAPAEFNPLQIGPLTVDPPVVLAPMAGVTNAPFRALCREFSGHRCLYVSEMITARAFTEGHKKTLKIASFGKGESVKSIQLYGTHPDALATATRVLVDEWGVDHIDINLGCPVRKVTANGGGAAIPARPKLMARLLRAVIDHAGEVPVTCKFRKGIDDDLMTFLDAGRVAEDVGCRAIALHARTAAQLYAGEADWTAITELKEQTKSIPVLGNGDIFEAFDALRMMRTTGCDGVVVGRGCLGRPWLFRDLVDAFDGREPQAPPTLGAIRTIALQHARLLIEFLGERIAMPQMRKFVGWYLKTFPGTKRSLPALQKVSTYAELEAALASLPENLPFPEAALRVRRCKTSRTQKVSLPAGFLDDRDDASQLYDHEDVVDGG